MRIPLSERNLPSYTRGEELFHMVSHIAGGVFAFVALLLCVIKAALGGNAMAIVTSTVYGITMIVLSSSTRRRTQSLVIFCSSLISHALQ